MKHLFTRTFFRFLIGFLIILAISFSILVFTAAQKKDKAAPVDSLYTSG